MARVTLARVGLVVNMPPYAFSLPSQVAQLTHRTVVFPDIPCEAPWLHAEDASNRGPVCSLPVNFPENRCARSVHGFLLVLNLKTYTLASFKLAASCCRHL